MLLDSSSNQLLKTHYLGRDGFVWWIGQVPLPQTGNWSRSDIKQIDVEGLYYNRVKVRIFGYHTEKCGFLSDDDLPWAHILVPPGVANGNLKSGNSHNIIGGETVFGFFLDGDDGQQPVIVGSLYKGSVVKDGLTSADVEGKGCSAFMPVNPGLPIGIHQIKVNQNPGGQNVVTGVGNPEDPGANKEQSQNGIDNIVSDTIANETFKQKSDDKSQAPNICQDDEISKITDALDTFIEKVKGYQRFLNVYVAGSVNKIVNIQSELRSIASLIAGIITKLIKKGMKILFDEITKKLNNLIADLFPKPKQSEAAQTVRTLMSAIYCLFKKFLKSILEYVIKQITSLIGQTLSAASCIVNNFIGQMLSQLFDALDRTIGPALNQLSSFLGGALGTANQILKAAMSAAGFLKSLINCESRNCTPPTKFSVRYGPTQQDADNFNNILNTYGAGGVANLSNDLGLSDVSYNYNNCNGNILKCGPPSVQILGGGGIGATANAVINSLGYLIGFNVTKGGSGYFEPPYVSIIDACNNGDGGRGTAIIENGSVIRIIVDDSGGGYLNNETSQEYGSPPVSNPTDSSNDDQSNSYVSEIGNVVVKTPGLGYGDDTGIVVIPGNNDVGQINEPEFEIVLGPNGSITEIKVTQIGYGYTEIPTLQIVSLTGVGAEITPVLNFKPVDQATDIIQGQVIKVVNCVQK